MRALFPLLLTLGSALAAAEPLAYTVDARDRSDDRLTVTITLPEALSEVGEFRMPATVPGTYQIQDWGRMVAAIAAFDADGAVLSDPRELDTNGWELPAGTASLRCELRDTFDAELGTREIWPMAGTNVEDDNLVLNWFGFCGYLPGREDEAVRLELLVDPEWSVAGAVPVTAEGDGRWSWDYESYHHLADSPAIAGAKLVEHRFEIAGCEVLCAAVDVHGEPSVFTADYLEGAFRPVVVATRDWLGHLPAERYAFLIHARRGGGFQVGALEHRTSSLYHVVPGLPAPLLSQIGAHEFLHIVTPLNLRSELIDDFDYADPRAPDHLWFYEGAVEYASLLVRRRAGHIGDRAFATQILGKFAVAQRFPDDISLLDLSRGCYGEHRDLYLDIYHRGALVAMAFDLELRRLTGNETGLRELLLAMLDRYGPDRPFDHQQLFGLIAELTHPEIEPWLATHVAGAERPDYAGLLAQAGFALTQAEADGEIWARGLTIDPEASEAQIDFRQRWLGPPPDSAAD